LLLRNRTCAFKDRCQWLLKSSPVYTVDRLVFQQTGDEHSRFSVTVVAVGIENSIEESPGVNDFFQFF